MTDQGNAGGEQAGAVGGGRRSGRGLSELRSLGMERGVAPYAEGSCLATFGDTRVLCAVSVEAGVPSWRRGSGEGWITAEYAMLPRATRTRTGRERTQLGGRTQEIQRLIGRSARAMLDSFAFGEFTVKIDCDVLQADGGTRTAAISGAAVALSEAFGWMVSSGLLVESPVRRLVAGVSVGIVGGEVHLDLDYDEDVRAEVDMNVVMSSDGGFVEVQGTGERGTFSQSQLAGMLKVAGDGVSVILAAQRGALGL